MINFRNKEGNKRERKITCPNNYKGRELVTITKRSFKAKVNNKKQNDR